MNYWILYYTEPIIAFPRRSDMDDASTHDTTLQCIHCGRKKNKHYAHINTHMQTHVNTISHWEKGMKTYVTNLKLLEWNEQKQHNEIHYLDCC